MVDGLTAIRTEALDNDRFGTGVDSASVVPCTATHAFAAGPQTTLRHPVQCSGVGLHCGELVNLTLKPAPAGTGIRFFRTDVSPSMAWIDGRWDAVTDTTLCTTIGNAHGVRVATVEHLMAALAAAGVDNVIVELDAAEPPAMDGSAQPFLFLIKSAGIVIQAEPRAMLRIVKPIRVEDGVKFAAFLPAQAPVIDVAIDFENPVIGRQRIALPLSGSRFGADLAKARTFGFAHEVAYMQSKGLARGGSLDNAVVIQDETILNPGGLRYTDEFVRHKALDAVGDLYLAGGPFIGRYVGNQPGHKLNNLLLRKLMADATAFEWIKAGRSTVNTPA
jgi:UDP-3-O-[3-hydroxymyristoyl] N-acetylglucosamine deacetylase